MSGIPKNIDDLSPSQSATQLENRLDRLWADRPRFAPSLAAGQVLGNYRIRMPLGAGAFGLVYLADDLRNQRPVALKVPRPEVLLDPERLQRFADEAAAIAQLDHPGVVKLYESDITAVPPFIATQWCDGPNLEQWLAKQNQSNAAATQWSEAVAIVAKLADALEYVHQQGITHRDLKPANILLDRFSTEAPHGSKENVTDPPTDAANDGQPALADFTVRISDFGLSKWVGGSDSQTRSSLIVGTPVYMAPEQLEGVRVGSEPTHAGLVLSDIYSLAAILFELLTGQPPVQGRNYYEILANVSRSRLARLRSLCPNLPKSVYDVIATCLNPNPEARYRSAGELATDLRQVLAGKPATGRSISIGKRYRFWHDQQTWLATAGRFAIASGSLIAAWLVITSIAVFAHGAIPDQAAGSMIEQAVTLLLTSTLPMLSIGWFCIQGRRWAAWAGAIFNLGNLVAAVLGMLGRPLAFEELYFAHDIYFCFTIHLFIFLCYASLQTLFVFALTSGQSTLPRKNA